MAARARRNVNGGTKLRRYFVPSSEIFWYRRPSRKQIWKPKKYNEPGKEYGEKRVVDHDDAWGCDSGGPQEMVAKFSITNV